MPDTLIHGPEYDYVPSTLVFNLEEIMVAAFLSFCAQYHAQIIVLDINPERDPMPTETIERLKADGWSSPTRKGFKVVVREHSDDTAPTLIVEFQVTRRMELYRRHAWQLFGTVLENGKPITREDFENV